MKNKRIRILLSVIMVIVMITVELPQNTAAAATNGYNNEIIYEPVPLTLEGNELMFFDADMTHLSIMKDMSSAQEKKYLMDNKLNLNKFGKRTESTGDNISPSIFCGTIRNSKYEKYTAKYDFSILSQRYPTITKGNIANIVKKGDLSSAFAYKVWKHYHDKNMVFYKKDKSTRVYVRANTEEAVHVGCDGNEWSRKNYSTMDKLILPEDAWKPIKYRYTWPTVYFRAYAASDGPVDTWMEDGIMVGKDSVGPSILSVDVSKSATIPGADDHMYDANGVKNNSWIGTTSIVKEDIGKIVYISVQFDEPIKFKDSFATNENLTALELEVQTVGRDGSSAQPVAAKFLKYAPDTDTSAPCMIFEYQIQDPDGPDAIRKDKYYAFDSVEVSQNNNAKMFQYITDMAGNAFGEKNGIQNQQGMSFPVLAPIVHDINFRYDDKEPDYRVGCYTIPVLDLEPFVVENTTITVLGEDENNQYLSRNCAIDITLNLNKTLKLEKYGFTHWTEKIPPITLNVKNSKGNYITIDPKEDWRVYKKWGWPNYHRASYITTKQSVNSPPRTSITYHLPLSSFGNLESEGEIAVKSIDFDKIVCKDNSGYQLSYNDSSLVTDKNYYVDMVKPNVNVEITEPSKGIFMIKANIEDANMSGGREATFTISSDMVSKNPFQYQIATDNTYDSSSWMKTIAGKNLVVSAPVSGNDAYLFIKLPEKAEVGKIDAMVRAFDAAGNIGCGKTYMTADYDTNPPVVSLNQVLGMEGIAAKVTIIDKNDISYEYAWVDGLDGTKPETSDFSSPLIIEGGKEHAITINYEGDLNSNKLHKKTLWVNISDGVNEISKSVNCEFNNLYGEINFTAGIPDDQDTFITDSYPEVTADFTNTKWYDYVWIEYDAAFIDNKTITSAADHTFGEDGINRVESSDVVVDSLESDCIVTTGSLITGIDISEGSSKSENTIKDVEFKLNSDSHIYTYDGEKLNKSGKANNLSKPVLLLIQALDVNDEKVYKTALFNTFYEPGGTNMEQVRFSSNNLNGTRFDINRVNKGGNGTPIYYGINNLIDKPIDYSTKLSGYILGNVLNAEPIFDFAQNEFTLTQIGVTGLEALDLDPSDGKGTRLTFKKIMFTADIADTEGSNPSEEGNDSMLYDGCKWSFKNDTILSDEIIQKWDIKEDMLSAVPGGKKNGSSGAIDYIADYVFTVDLDIDKINPEFYEYYEEDGETKVRFIRYEFWLEPYYTKGNDKKGKPQKISIFAFQNKLPSIVIKDVCVKDQCTEEANVIKSFLTEPLQPFKAALNKDTEGKISDDSYQVPQMTFRDYLIPQYNYLEQPSVVFEYALPRFAQQLLSAGLNAEHNYGMKIGKFEDLKVENGDITLDVFSEGSYMYNTHGYQLIRAFEGTLETGDTISLYYQFVDDKDINDEISSPIYRMDLVYDDTPPVVNLNLSEENREANSVIAQVLSVYDGHMVGTGDTAYYVVDTPVQDIQIEVEAEYTNGDKVTSEDNLYLFDENGKIVVTATDKAGNSTTVEKTINNIDTTPPTIDGTPVIEAEKGKFSLKASVPDLDVDSAYIKFDKEYTLKLTNDTQDDSLFSVKDNAIPGAMLSTFENGKIDLEIYARDNVTMKTATLIVTDKAGNESELEMNLDLEGIKPSILNKDKTYVYDENLEFNVPVKLKNIISDQRDYCASHGNLPIYEDGSVTISYMDLFDREYNEIITANIFGTAYEHSLKITPDTLTNQPVIVSIDTEDYATTVSEGKDANHKTIVVTDNGNISYTIIPNDPNILQKTFVLPITNIDKVSPVAFFTRTVNGEETFDDEGKSTVIGSVTYTIIGFNEKDVSMADGEINTVNFNSAGEHIFHFADVAGNEGILTVSELNTIFQSPMDLTIDKYRLTYTVGGSSVDPMQVGHNDSDEQMPQLSTTNKDISVLIQALNKDGDIIPSTMEIMTMDENIQYYIKQNTVVFTSDGTTTVKLKTSSESEIDVTVAIPSGTIDKIAPTASVDYVMLSKDETLSDGTVLKKGAVKAYLVQLESGVQVFGEGVRQDTDERYFIYFEENGISTFYLVDEAENTGSVVAGSYGIDITAPKIINESWYSGIAAAIDAPNYTSGNGKEEVLSTITNNSIRLFFTFDEQIGDVKVESYTNNKGKNVLLQNTSDYIGYTALGSTLTIEFKKNCQAKIIVYDTHGNSINLWRPDDGPITVIDKAAPVIKNSEFVLKDNKAEITYTFDEDVVLTSEKTKYQTKYTITFEENGNYPLTFADKAGNVVTTVAKIDQIDSMSPEICYALQIVTDNASILYADDENKQVKVTDGDVEIAIGAQDVNHASIKVVNRNKPFSLIKLHAPTIGDNSAQNYTKAVTVKENGVYLITATDDYGNINAVYVKIDFIDKTAPTISMENNKVIEIQKETVSADELSSLLLEGVTAEDDRDGNVTSMITVDITPVDLNLEGLYTVTYSVSDKLGNTSQKTRSVEVIESARQTILINGKTVVANDMYITLPGTIEIGAPSGYKLYATEGYKTRAQMKYVLSMNGTLKALNKGYYTILMQNSDHDAFLVYVYVI